MSFDFLDRRSAERFAELLDQTTTGGRHHSRSPADAQFAELVAIGHSLSAARPGIQVEPEFRVGLRAMLVATADRDGLGRTDAAIAADHAGAATAAPARTGLRALALGRGGRRIRARGAIVIGVAAGALAVSGISAASENASPGELLYGMKRSTERAQLAMAGSDVTRGQLSLDFARTRLTEAANMPGDAADFASVLDDMDADTRKGVRLLNTSAVARRDVKPLATVDTFVAAQRQTLNPALAGLSPVNRERAEGSLELLDDITKRGDDLRAGLNCSTVVSAGADQLGPKLRDCTTTAADGGTARPSGRSGKVTTKSGRAANEKNPAARPDRTGGPTAAPEPTRTVATTPARRGGTEPNLTDSSTTVTDVVPLSSIAPAEDTTGTTTTTDDKKPGLIGGLLGGLLGQK